MRQWGIKALLFASTACGILTATSCKSKQDIRLVDTSYVTMDYQYKNVYYTIMSHNAKSLKRETDLYEVKPLKLMGKIFGDKYESTTKSLHLCSDDRYSKFTHAKGKPTYMEFKSAFEEQKQTNALIKAIQEMQHLNKKELLGLGKNKDAPGNEVATILLQQVDPLVRVP